MIGQCCAKRGLLTLRECGDSGIHTCLTCNRGLCQAHAILQGAPLPAQQYQCPDCYAAEDEADSGSGNDGVIAGATTSFGTTDRRSVTSRMSLQAGGGTGSNFTDS